MAVLNSFRGIRPLKDNVRLVASRPYDVLSSSEAKEEAGENHLSFYHVIKPEIDFPSGFNPYSPEVYKKGKENMDRMISEGIFFQDPEECFYIYRQEMDGRRQTGIVGCASVDDYLNNVIRKHELTRPDKEEDRKNHIRVSGMNYEPVFFSYRASGEIDGLVNKIILSENPEYDFTADDTIAHRFWIVRDKTTIQKIQKLFLHIPYTYVADGHHRTAAAALVGKERRDANPHHTGNEEYNFFLAVLFPDDQLKIFDYNRVVKDLNGMTAEEFLKRVSESFIITAMGGKSVHPADHHTFGIYLEGKWFSLIAKPGTWNDADPVEVLDVTILDKKILNPLLGIKDQRTDKRIDFVGGIRGTAELEKRVNNREMRIAFSLAPVTMNQLIAIADTGNIMPPKTTWFEPKLRSGLVIHSLE
ncbi:MAG: DUF1015 domain-containing protein [Bacteroidetes bacterium]|nr:DUF1015 domain-containing protein [Bacteroidota bacterium]